MMRIIEPSFTILDELDGNALIAKLEAIGRICYKSESKITGNSAPSFIAMLLRSGHDSVIEHESISVKIVCDRGVSHEIVRHRIASYSQESTRYCNYSNDKFGNELTFIKPFFWRHDKTKYDIWLSVMQAVSDAYIELLAHGASPEEARSILPNSLKTELMMTMNLREWRHFFRLRTSKKAHPQMRELTSPMLCAFKALIPVIFDDIQLAEPLPINHS